MYILLFVITGILLGFLSYGMGIKSRREMMNNTPSVKGKSVILIGITLAILSILFNTVMGAVLISFQSRISKTHSLISKVKAGQSSLATALESYYIDNCVYPRADFDENDNPIIPHVLTTPVAYAPCGSSNKKTVTFISDCNVVHDPFNKDGKGFYGYGGGPVTGGSPKSTWPSTGWIVTSYGPDTVSGNTSVPGGKPLVPSQAWTDSTGAFVIVPLKQSPLTYDPSNGLYSPGDVWRRGP